MKKMVFFAFCLFLIVLRGGIVSANQKIDVVLEISSFNLRSGEIADIITLENEGVKFRTQGYINGIYLFGKNFPILDSPILTINGKDYKKFSKEFLDNVDIIYGEKNNTEMIKNGRMKIFTILVAEDNSSFIGNLEFNFNEDNFNWIIVTGIIVPNYENFKDHEQRISTLESWQQTMNTWKDSIGDTISNILSSITELLTSSDNHKTRIQTLENRTGNAGLNLSVLNYWKYLKSSDRKNIVCGVAKDNHLDTLVMEELSYKCDVRYRQTSRGERASCRCRKLR